MPNCCCNDIRVSGPSAEIDAFLRAAEGVPEDRAEASPLSLERLLPIPPEMLTGDGWYDWCVRHWGTKWDLYDIWLDDPSPAPRADLPGDCREILICCVSAWAPPLPALRSISGLFPALAFRIDYDEPGMDFAGTAVFWAGHGGGGRGRSRFNRSVKQIKRDDDEGENDEDEDEYGDTDSEDIVFTFTVGEAASLTSEEGLGEAVQEALATLMSRGQSLSPAASQTDP